ncbi:MAG: SH3 domain-containing protein [Oceanospirillaceae bacterium]|nr:SH3 domain-containing protein [Oceanospirillaceae bacterium]
MGIRPLSSHPSRCFYALLIAAGLCCQPAAAVSLQEATLAWQAHRYQDAYGLLSQLRERPYGRQPVSDFMLATSGCRLDSVKRDYGHRLLDWMLYAYALSQPSRELVAAERDLCRKLDLALGGITPGNIEERRSAGMRGYGKSFYWAGQDQPVSSYPMRRLRPISREELQRRQVPVGDAKQALALAESLAPGQRYLVEERLLIIGTRDHSDDDLKRVGQTLSRYLRFLERQYGVALPDYYLRIHLAGAPGEVRELAERLHGLDVSRATIGYAFVEDGAVVGFVPQSAAGTLLHELFHLLVRSNFGDIPQWLDEGVASLYEVSGRRGDEYFGLENWRRKVLDSQWHLRPTVAELIGSEWFLFDDPNQVRAFREEADYEGYHDHREGAKQAAMMATARYFALYLEQQNRLAPVYRAVRDGGLPSAGQSPREHTITLVESVLQQPIEVIDQNFVAWYRQDGRQSLRVSREGGELFSATTGVSVRNGPGTAFDRLMIIPKDTIVAVHGRDGVWREVRLSDGNRAYIHSDYLVPTTVNDKTLPE